MEFKSEYQAPRARCGALLYERSILSPFYPGGTPDSDDYDDNPLGDL